MRVIAGHYRGRRLRTPAGLDTRPILDRVKTALFDMLGARLAAPGTLPPVNVLDCFCGAGSLGIEALSRGAALCVFVEAHPQALACLRDNLDNLGVGATTRIIGGPAQTVTIPAPPGDPFGLVFLDPPYRFNEDLSPGGVMGRVVARLASDIAVGPDGVLVWRHDAKVVLPDELPGGWVSWRRRRWGSMAVSLFEQSRRERHAETPKSQE